jgi:hypothetical protein
MTVDGEASTDVFSDHMVVEDEHPRSESPESVLTDNQLVGSSGSRRNPFLDSEAHDSDSARESGESENEAPTDDERLDEMHREMDLLALAKKKAGIFGIYENESEALDRLDENDARIETRRSAIKRGLEENSEDGSDITQVASDGISGILVPARQAAKKAAIEIRQSAADGRRGVKGGNRGRGGRGGRGAKGGKGARAEKK